MTNQTNSSPRRWYQFRLRTLLIFMTLCAFPFAWGSSELESRRREKLAVAWVKGTGGAVRRFRFPFYPILDGVPKPRAWSDPDTWFGETVRQVHLVTEQVKDLTRVADFKRLQRLKVYDVEVRDLSPIAELNNLEHLDVARMQASDLSSLRGLTNLRRLSIRMSPVSDLSPVAPLENLMHLTLSQTKVSDLSPLAKLHKLVFLDLNGTQVSDPTPLAGLKNLKELNLDYTLVTKEEIAKLQHALPNCIIHWSEEEAVEE